MKHRLLFVIAVALVTAGILFALARPSFDSQANYVNPIGPTGDSGAASGGYPDIGVWNLPYNTPIGEAGTIFGMVDAGTSGWFVPPSSAGGAVQSATVTTSESTTVNGGSNTYQSLTTYGPSVTMTTGTTALVWISATCYFAGTNNNCLMSLCFGSTTPVNACPTGSVSALDTNGTAAGSNGVNLNGAPSRMVYVTGLTPGTNIFTLVYRSGANGTATTFFDRSIAVARL